MMAASGFLEPLDEKVAREMCSLEGVATPAAPSIPRTPIISEWR